ncbi:MAG: molybdopterin-binding protein [Treponema sp.]|nr:molybdopterin-binding protein [Treponema sp.]
MGKVIAVCISAEKGTPKINVKKADFAVDHGLMGDAHAGAGHRQVSLLSYNKVEEFRAKGARVEDGAFGENLVVDGIDFRSLPLGTRLECGEVILEISQIGKECHSRCAIFEAMGDCIMPREGVFAKVLRGGYITAGDEMKALPLTFDAAEKNQPLSFDMPEKFRASKSPYSFWIITCSDSASRGERLDESCSVIRELAAAAGYIEAGYTLLSDDKEGIENELKRICDNGLASLVLTSGGTGFSPRDNVPEATAAVAERLVPGIADAMRAESLKITKRAILSRAISAIRGKTLIVNLPGSPLAVRENLSYIISELHHGLDILTGRDRECARK